MQAPRVLRAVRPGQFPGHKPEPSRGGAGGLVTSSSGATRRAGSERDRAASWPCEETKVKEEEVAGPGSAATVVA